jgi:hypothetical protein
MGRPADSTESTFSFQQCPGCDYDFLTGEGNRACNWYECPYLPDELKVFCPQCNYNFFTDEGSPSCGSPPSCRWAEAGYEHAAFARILERAPPS